MTTIPKPDIHNDAAKANSPKPPTQQFIHRDEDVRLMMRFQDGDEKAFDALVMRHKNRIFGVLQRMVNDRDEIEDLTQEVFLRVFRSRSSYTPAAKFSTWLYRIATNLALNAMRSRRRLRVFTTTDSENSVLNEKTDDKNILPDEKLQKDEMAAHVRSAIDTLPESQKAAIILRRYENLSYEQIAEIMNLSSPAVKSLLNRARNNLKKHLEKYIR